MKCLETGMLLTLGILVGCAAQPVDAAVALKVVEEIDRTALQQRALALYVTTKEEHTKRIETGNYSIALFCYDRLGYLYLNRIYAWCEDGKDTETVVWWSQQYESLKRELEQEVVIEVRISLIDPGEIRSHVRVPRDPTAFLSIRTDDGEALSIESHTRRGAEQIVSPLEPECIVAAVIENPFPREEFAGRVTVEIQGLPKLGVVRFRPDFRRLPFSDPLELRREFLRPR